MKSLPIWNDISLAAVAGGLNLGQLSRLKSSYLAILAEQAKGAFCLQEANRMLAKQSAAPESEYLQFFQGAELDRAYLLITLACHGEARRNFIARGYPVECFDEAWTDLQSWSSYNLRNFQVLGLKRRFYGWYGLHVSGELIELGRLQFQLGTQYTMSERIVKLADGALEAVPADSPLPSGAVLLLEKDDPVVAIHIPEGRPGWLQMSPQECRNSLKRLLAFVREYFQAEPAPKAIFCHSWLLDTALTRLLPPESNIVQFQQLGNGVIIPGRQGHGEAVWRLFGDAGLPAAGSDLSRYSRLQRNVVDYVRHGGQFADAGMVIPWERLLAFCSQEA